MSTKVSTKLYRSIIIGYFELMTDDDKLINLEFDELEYLPDRILVEEQNPEPLEVNFEFELDQQKELDLEQLAVAKPIDITKILDPELQVFKIQTTELSNPDMITERLGVLEEIVEATKILTVSTTEMFSEISFQDQQSDIQFENEQPVSLEVDEVISDISEISDSEALALFKQESDSSDSLCQLEALSAITNAVSGEDLTDKSTIEDTEQGYADQELVKTNDPQYKTRDFVIYLIVAGVLLFIANYFLFASHQAPNLRTQSGLNQHILKITSSHLEQKKALKKISKHMLENKIKGKNYSGHVYLHLEDSLVKSFDLKIYGQEPDPLTAEQIVAAVRQGPWIQRIEINNLSLVRTENGEFAGTGKARVYLQDEELKKRILVTLSVRGNYQDGSDSAGLELTVQEGSSHLNLKEINKNDHSDRLWVKPYKEGYDILFNSSITLKRQ